MHALLLATLLAQAGADAGAAVETTPPVESTPAPAVATTTADDAATRAALAAERTAAAAERLAGALERLSPLVSDAGTADGTPPVVSDVTWSSQASLGMIALAGNAQSVTLNAGGSVERKSPGFIFTGKAVGRYGQSDPVDTTKPTEVLARAAGLELRADKRFTQRYSAYAATGFDADHIKSVEARGFGEGGAGIIWIDDTENEKASPTFLRTDVAFRYSQERRYQFFPTPMDVADVSLIAPRFGVLFRHALSDHVKFSEEVEALPSILGPSRLLVNSTTKLSAALAAGLSVGVSFVVTHDSLPATGKVPTDTALGVAFELAL